jgi:hypothetical protein
MNERIRQLAEQAFFDEATSQPSTKMYTFSEHKMEKFAELIVGECIEQVITGPNGPAHYAVEAALRLKKHFGVEE